MSSGLHHGSQKFQHELSRRNLSVSMYGALKLWIQEEKWAYQIQPNPPPSKLCAANVTHLGLQSSPPRHLVHCQRLLPAPSHSLWAWCLKSQWKQLRIRLCYSTTSTPQEPPVIHRILLKLVHSPTCVAPASMLFSTSSFTAVARLSTTCPEQIWCTECLSMALMPLAGSELELQTDKSD